MSYPQPTTGVGIAARLTLDTDAVTLAAVSDTHQLIANVTDATGTAVTVQNTVAYESQNPAVASVSGSGLVTAVAPGTTTIVASYSPAPGVSFDAEVSIVVTPPYPICPPYVWYKHWDGTEWVGEDAYPTA